MALSKASEPKPFTNVTFGGGEAKGLTGAVE
jgi:hypothetical protein